MYIDIHYISLQLYSAINNTIATNQPTSRHNTHSNLPIFAISRIEQSDWLTTSTELCETVSSRSWFLNGDRVYPLRLLCMELSLWLINWKDNNWWLLATTMRFKRIHIGGWGKQYICLYIMLVDVFFQLVFTNLLVFVYKSTGFPFFQRMTLFVVGQN